MRTWRDFKKKKYLIHDVIKNSDYFRLSNQVIYSPGRQLFFQIILSSMEKILYTNCTNGVLSFNVYNLTIKP